jgi:hypothetical protein
MTGYFIHQPLNTEITSIGGHYLLIKEVRLPFDGRDVLYVSGCAVTDTSCCGASGCAFADVPGYILAWKENKDPDGFYISSVEYVTDIATQNSIREIIKKNDGVIQVNFRE